MRQQGSCYIRHQTESEAAPYQDGACIEAVLTWPSVSHVICGATLFFFAMVMFAWAFLWVLRHVTKVKPFVSGM